jgi:hypothetical protein
MVAFSLADAVLNKTISETVREGQMQSEYDGEVPLQDLGQDICHLV